jgi:hypothetical protein
VRSLIDCDENMLATPVRPISSVMTPISVVVIMPVRVVPVVFPYDHGISFSSNSSDYGPENKQDQIQCFHKIYVSDRVLISKYF